MSVVVESRQFGELYCPGCETSYPSGRTCPRCATRLVKLVAVVDPIIGRELDGRFTVLEKLGQGGMGAVYRAYQHSVDRDVAIKIVNPSLIADPEAIKRFLREAKLTSRLSHPNAVGVLDFGQTEDGVFYLVMELVQGRTLDKVLAEGILPPTRVVKVGIQVCDALEAAHGLQIIHRDLKPTNIMLAGRDFVKVLDFGLAKSLDITQEIESSNPGDKLLGTPAFLPPERVRLGMSDGRGDLYSLGCVLYWMSCGQLPFRADSAPELAVMHARVRHMPLANVPAALAEVIDRLLAKDPDQRYQTAAEARDALEAAVSVRMSSQVSVASGQFPFVDPEATQIVSVLPLHRPRRGLILGLALLLGSAGGIAAFLTVRDNNAVPAAAVTSPEPASETSATPPAPEQPPEPPASEKPRPGPVDPAPPAPPPPEPVIQETAPTELDAPPEPAPARKSPKRKKRPVKPTKPVEAIELPEDLKLPVEKPKPPVEKPKPPVEKPKPPDEAKPQLPF